MTVPGQDDKRRHFRVGFTTPIRIQLEAEGKQIDIRGSSRDLSLKGIFIKTPDKFAPGTKCAVRVYLTGTRDEIALVMNATIIRQNDEGMGIVFDSMDVDTYSHLKKIVSYNRDDDN